MRRITMWITATLAAVALMTSYQANLSGVTGKGEETGPPGVTSVETIAVDPVGLPEPIAPVPDPIPADTAPTPTALPAPTPAGNGGGDLDVHLGKPGENR